MNPWPWLILVTAYGACVGSFLNVVIYRLPEGKSIVSPPSSCPRCGHRLAWFDNVPVLAWLWLDVALATVSRDDDPAQGQRAAMRYFFAYELPKIDAWLGVVASRNDVCRTMQDAWF